MITTPLLATLVCGISARNHDFDFARRKLLDALYAAGNVRTDTFNTYDALGVARRCAAPLTMRSGR